MVSWVVSSAPNLTTVKRLKFSCLLKYFTPLGAFFNTEKLDVTWNSKPPLQQNRPYNVVYMQNVDR